MTEDEVVGWHHMSLSKLQELVMDWTGKPVTLQSMGSQDLDMTRQSLVAQMVKRLPTMRETLVQSLGREDPLEKEMETHFSILAWRIP